MLIGGALLLGIGCGTTQTGYERADDVASLARELASDVEATQAGVGEAIEALNRLTQPGTENAREHFNSFRAGLETAEERWKAVNERMDRLRRETEVYFSDWEDDIADLGNEEMRATARSRRSDLRATVSSLDSQYEDTRQTLAPYLERMRNVAQMLRNDLTREGIRASEDAIHRLREEARQQNSLGNLLFEANETARALAVAS